VRVYDPAKLKIATPAKSQKYYQAGLQAQQGGDLRIAEIFYQKALADSPDHLNSMINLSAIYVQQERFREAEEILWVILGVDKSNSKALVNLGVINLYQGRNVKAEGYFLKALQANPREENGLVNLAYLAEQKKDYAAAEMYYKQILQITPANLEVLLAYAYMLEQQYRYPEALVVYKDSLDLDAMRNNKELFARVLERRNQLARDVRDSRQ
jgi:tetratricopeptide (TPR) repeat protein